jgi:hypothetical protein
VINEGKGKERVGKRVRLRIKEKKGMEAARISDGFKLRAR